MEDGIQRRENHIDTQKEHTFQLYPQSYCSWNVHWSVITLNGTTPWATSSENKNLWADNQRTFALCFTWSLSYFNRHLPQCVELCLKQQPCQDYKEDVQKMFSLACAELRHLPITPTSYFWNAAENKQDELLSIQ